MCCMGVKLRLYITGTVGRVRNLNSPPLLEMHDHIYFHPGRKPFIPPPSLRAVRDFDIAKCFSITIYVQHSHLTHKV